MKNFILNALLLVTLATGISFASYVGPNPYSSQDLTNVGVKAEISSNQLLVTLIGKSGGAPAASNILNIGFRQSTATLGSFSTASLKTAKTITLGTTDSLGVTSGVASVLNVYVINDSTNEICLSKSLFDESTLLSATALTGGADTSASVLYCPSTHTSKPIRLIGQVTAIWSNPNWGTISKVSPPFSTTLTKALTAGISMYAYGSTSATTAAEITIVNPTVGVDTAGGYNSGTGVYTVQVSGKYRVSGTMSTNTTSTPNTNHGFALSIYKNSTSYSRTGFVWQVASVSLAPSFSNTVVVDAVAGDTITLRTNHNASVTDVALDGTIGNTFSIDYVSE